MKPVATSGKHNVNGKVMGRFGFAVQKLQHIVSHGFFSREKFPKRHACCIGVM